MNSPKRLARIAGVLYLLVGILGGFAVGVALTMYVPGDAAATTANVVANAGLVRLGVVSDLVNQAVLVLLALTLYRLLRQVHRGAVVRVAAIDRVRRDELGRHHLQVRGRSESLPVSGAFLHRFRGM